MTRQQYERALEASAKRQNSPTTGAPIGNSTEPESTTSNATIQLSGLKSTRKFAAYCRNNHETWQPALFLEEPDDPQKICYYAKSTVYPQGLSGVEYSPEEIRARRYKQKMDELQQKQQLAAAADEQHHRQQLQSQQAHVQVQEIGTLKGEHEQYNQTQPSQHQPQPHEQNQHYYVQQPHQNLHHINNNHLYYQQQPQEQPTQGQGVTQIYQQQYQSNHNYPTQEYNQQQYAAKHSEEDDYASVGTEDQDDNPDTEEDEQQTQQREQYQNHYQRQQMYQHQLQVHSEVHTEDDLEDQIEASTIRFSMHTPTQGSQNKTLKIKFKKERPSTGLEKPNGNNNYSAYTIERIYQPEVSNTPVFNDNIGLLIL